MPPCFIKVILIPQHGICPLLASSAPLSAVCDYSTLHYISDSTCQSWHNCVFTSLPHMTLSTELREGRGTAWCIVETPGPSTVPCTRKDLGFVPARGVSGKDSSAYCKMNERKAPVFPHEGSVRNFSSGSETIALRLTFPPCLTKCFAHKDIDFLKLCTNKCTPRGSLKALFLID